jgi:hypothetical protein
MSESAKEREYQAFVNYINQLTLHNSVKRKGYKNENRNKYGKKIVQREWNES